MYTKYDKCTQNMSNENEVRRQYTRKGYRWVDIIKNVLKGFCCGICDGFLWVIIWDRGTLLWK
jgi:hypothetical protein